MKLPPSSFFLGLAVATLVSLFIWKFLGAPVKIVDAPAGKVHCVSYAPYRDGESPLDPTFRVSAANIDEDLALLAKVTDCVRTYSIDSGLDQIVPLAEKRGMKVILGVWISAEKAKNDFQIAHAKQLIHDHPNTIKAIIVGNEVLLRGEQTPDQLIAHLNEIRNFTDIPVTYADVTDFWMKAPPELAAAVDFITIHILPYWENDPRSAAHGVAYLDQVRKDVAAKFPGRMIFIGETGYPSAGRQRSEAVPSLIAQAKYLRELADYAEKHDLDYNLIEAFDQSWKRSLEGTVGGHWGFFTADRKPKFPWTGEVSNDPQWRLKAGIAVGLSAVLFSIMIRRRLKLDALVQMITGAGAAVAASAFILQIQHSLIAWRSAFEAFGEILLGLQSILLLLILLPELTKGHNASAPLPIIKTLIWLRAPRWEGLSASLYLGLLRLTTTFSALVISLALSFDARYLDFPNAAFLLPAIGFAFIAFKRGDYRKPQSDRPEEALFATLLIAAAIVIAFNEGPYNFTALTWCMLNLLLAFPWVAIWWQAVRRLFFSSAAASKA